MIPRPSSSEAPRPGASLQPLLSGLDAPETFASPLCMYEHCQRKGRAVYGDPEIIHDEEIGDWTHIPIRCLLCHCTGGTIPRDATTGRGQRARRTRTA